MIMAKEDCNMCTFFKTKQGRGVVGVCRRFPKGLDKKPTEWCGEYIRDPQLIKVHEPEHPHAAGNCCAYCGLEAGDHTHWCRRPFND